ncbi:cationic amino acid transporter 2-like [Galendromus occidentalis]|uniref:Cationic amino acid transporter 2-like n=1 Tax=Galendromus occidentalis TaxID=34638 RepID=A0AAJ6QV83_9ACAR|nr:cationic amino acid transporter 2-like [Galendromus occidentalis]
MARRKNSQAALLEVGVGERSKLNLFSTALSPGYAFGVLIIVVCAFNYVPQGALVPSLLVAAVASLLSGFCYSELVSHVANGTRETSVYELLYKWLNEGFAYSAAWISVLYYTCATALCARILAVCCDMLSDGALNKLTSGLTGINLDLGVALVVIPCGVLLMSWNPLSRLIVDPSNGRVRTWVNFLLISTALLVEGVFVAGVAFLRHSTIKPAPPPGGVLGNTIAAVVFRHSESTGLLTGAVLCVSIFLAPQFSLQGSPLAASTPNDGCPPEKNKIKPHKDLPCIVVLSAFGNFLFCLALIAALCSLSKTDAALLSDPLAAQTSSQSSSSIAICINWVVTVSSTVSLALLIISNLAELNKIMRTLGHDGLFPRFCKRHHLFVAVVISIWSGLVLRAGQLVMMMSSGPVLMNVLICFCTIVFRYRKVEARKPAVFSYNLIVGGSADNEQTPILAKRDSVYESQSELSASNTNNDSAEEDRVEDCPFKEEEDIDDIVKEYKIQLSLSSQESLPILPPHRRVKLSRKTRRVKYFIVGLLACFVCVSVMLQGLSCSLRLSPTILATLAVCAAAAALCAVVLMIALAQQKQVIPKKNRPNKSGKPALMFRVPMSPWLPALGAFLNVLLFVDVFTTNLCSMFCWFIAGGFLYVLHGAHHSAATNAFPCVLQTNSRQMISHSEDGTDVRVTLEPLPSDPWGDSDDQAEEKDSQAFKQQRKRGKKKDPFNPIENIVMKL